VQRRVRDEEMMQSSIITSSKICCWVCQWKNF